MDSMYYVILMFIPGVLYLTWYLLFKRPRLKSELQQGPKVFYTNEAGDYKLEKQKMVFEMGPKPPPSFEQAKEAIHDYLRAVDRVSHADIRDMNSVILVLRDRIDVLEKWYHQSQRENDSAMDLLAKAIDILIKVDSSKSIKEYKEPRQVEAVSQKLRSDRKELEFLFTLTKKLSSN